MQPERPEHEPELQHALDAWQPEPARAAFREKLRGLFVQVGSTSADESGMVEVAVAPELAEALDTYAPKARGEFRDRLRAEFVSGTVTDQASSDDSTGADDLSIPRVPQVQRGRWRPLILLAAAAALMLWILRPVDPKWTIDPAGFVAAGLTIDGRALPEGMPLREAAGLLSTAEKVQTSDNSLRLVLGELFVVEMAESSTLDLSRMPEDLGQGDLVLRGIEGGFRVATGPKFKAFERKLRFETSDVDVEVVGTIFGVDLFPNFTCVCCLEGEVATAVKRGAPHVGVVKTGSTNIIHKDGKPVQVTRFEPHMVRLENLRAFWPE